MRSVKAPIALDAADDERRIVAAAQDNAPVSFVRIRGSRLQWLLDAMLYIPRGMIWVFQRMRQDAAIWLEPPNLCDMLPAPPMSHTSKDLLTRDQFGEHLLHNLFRLSPRYANAAVQVAKVAAILSKYPDHERIAVFAHFTLSRISTRENGFIPVSWMRARMADVGRSALNRALEDLEQDGFVRLLSVDTDDAKFVADGIPDVHRGRLTHIELLHPL